MNSPANNLLMAGHIGHIGKTFVPGSTIGGEPIPEYETQGVKSKAGQMSVFSFPQTDLSAFE